MKRLLPLLVFLFLSGCISGSEWERVDVIAFDEAISEDNGGFLLDVRTTSEWELSKINGLIA